MRSFFNDVLALGKFTTYKLLLKNIPAGETQTFEYELGNDFFSEVEGPEVQRGKVKVRVQAKHAAASYELRFGLTGIIYIPCDRCLDDMEHEVNVEEKLHVKIGDEYREEGDDTLVIPEPGELNIAWLLYEFIALTIPLKHVHPYGKCNKEMSAQLHKMRAHLPEAEEENEEGELPPYEDDNSETPTDPRWDALKKLKR